MDTPEAPTDDLYDEAIRTERIVLQIASGGGDDLEYAAQRLEPEHFRSDVHRRVWSEFLAYRARGEPPDTLSLAPQLIHEGLDAMSVTGACYFGEEASIASLRPHQLEAGVRSILADSARRQRKSLGAALLNGGPQLEPEELAEKIRELTRTELGTRADNPVLSRACSGSQLASGEDEPVPSLVGDGLLTRGSLVLLAGHSGLGKTFMAMQLMRSLAAGAEFLGMACRPCRVGLVELEMPRRAIRTRLLRFAEPDSAWLESSTFLCIPDRRVNVLEPADQDWMAELCKANRLDVLILDPLNRLHCLDENKAGDVGRVVDAVLSVRDRTGACIVLIHHVSKRPQDPSSGPRTAVLEAIRGSTRLGNDPDLVLGMVEAPGKLVRLEFAKTRYCETPDPLFLKREPSGLFAVTDSPEDRSDRTRDRIEKHLLVFGPSTASDIAKMLKMSPKHIRRVLEVMGCPASDERPARYELPGQQGT